ncbi:hypothetical protein [Cupriavidus necator]
MADRPARTVDEEKQVAAMVEKWPDPRVRELFPKLRIPKRFACFYARKFVVFKVLAGGDVEILSVPEVREVRASLEDGFGIKLQDESRGIDQWVMHSPTPLGPYQLLVWVPHEQSLVWRQKLKGNEVQFDLVFSMVARMPSDPEKFRNPGKVYMLELNNFKRLYPKYEGVNL